MTPSNPALSARPRLLVCFDLREHALQAEAATVSDQFLVNCRRILAHARENGWMVAHVHRREASWRPSSPSVQGLEPSPAEPIFIQSGLSAFSNRAFQDLVGRYGRGELILIGCSSASSCLTTALAAYDLGMDVTLIDDAVASTPLEAEGLKAVGALTRSLQSPFVNLARTSDVLGPKSRLKLVHSR
jgi:nicotinamidase-related amidase